MAGCSEASGEQRLVHSTVLCSGANFAVLLCAWRRRLRESPDGERTSRTPSRRVEPAASTGEFVSLKRERCIRSVLTGRVGYA
jgi:hypothetical protein